MKPTRRNALGAWLFLAVAAGAAPEGPVTPGSPGDPVSWRTTWKPGIPGGVPAVTTIHTRIDAALYGDGRADASRPINEAIQAAGDKAASSGTRQVVLLPAGTYRLASFINLNRSGVVLRGAGPGQTTLVVDNGFLGIHLGRLHDYGPAWNVLGSIAKGSDTFQMANADAAEIEVGDVLEIDQRDPPAVLLPSGHQYMNGYVWLGDGRYHKRQPKIDFNGPGTGGTDWVSPAPSQIDASLGVWDNAANFNARFTGPWRSVGQQIEIRAKTAGRTSTTFAISNVFHLAFESSRAPQVWHTAARWTPSRNVPGTQYVGVESLRLVGGPNGSAADVGGIAGRNVAYCWVKGVEVSGDPAGGKPAIKGPMIALHHAFRCVVRESYVHHARTLRPNSACYGITLGNHGTDNLIEDNVATWLCKPIVLNSSGGGNVVGYNYVDNAVIEGSNWSENGIDLCHGSFCFGDLAEGNWAPNIGSDSTHGNAGFETIFRNFCSGRNSTDAPAPRSNLRALGADAWSGPHAVIANVLHAAEVGGGVAYEATPRSRPSPPSRGVVYRLGDNGSGGQGGRWDDGTAAANLFRHGNWDNVTGAVVWDPRTADRTLPASLYLPEKPAFFGPLPWPWVDPTGATGAERVRHLPAKVRFDAGRPTG